MVPLEMVFQRYGRIIFHGSDRIKKKQFSRRRKKISIPFRILTQDTHSKAKQSKAKIEPK